MFKRDFVGQFAGNKGFNIVPRAVVVIGDTPIIPLSFNLVTNNLFESDILTIRFPMELLDLSEIYKQGNKEGSVFVVELWTGYLDSRKFHDWTQDFGVDSRFNSNEELKQALLKDYKNVLTKRWVGLLKQFELAYEDVNQPDMTTIVCGDFSSILQNYEYERLFNGDESTVESVLKDINGSLKHFEFVFDNKVPQGNKRVLMGYNKRIKKDKSTGEETQEEKEVRYSTEGKTYWQVIKDMLDKARLRIVQDTENSTNKKIKYLIKERLTSDYAWLLTREEHFATLNLRNGRMGQATSQQIGVEIRSAQDNGETHVGTYPENISNTNFPEGSAYFIINGAKNQTEGELKARARDIAMEYGKYDLTGDMYIPNAIIGLQPNHNLIISDSTPFKKGRSLFTLGNDEQTNAKQHLMENKFDGSQNALNFTIKSITEDFVVGEGYTQKVEFYLNMSANFINPLNGTLKGRNLFPSAKKSPDGNPFKPPAVNKLPTPLQKIRMQGGI